ncbi:ABC transporter permease [Polaribacter pacificus]|uniref:ABC transporter permease n=1 Tax=Polaribacter pacificus TaxID=1775173 RepID=A0A917HX80_9FLAO|nr:ABC transporter permease [Polaribacter pacificus]GGG94100.1 ABC transporter permease [Polaribacter pacificus]
MYLFKIIKEYLRRIVRNYKIYAITILGMSIAIIASFHIYFFVQKEYSVDAFQENKEDLYRVLNTEQTFKSEMVFIGMAEFLKEEFPEVVDYIRITGNSFKVKNISEEEWQVFNKVDKSFFELLNFPIINGSTASFDNKVNHIVISKKIATKLFGNENPVGQTIEATQFNQKIPQSFIVIAVMQNIPKESTIVGDFFLPFAKRKSIWEGGPEVTAYLFMPNLISQKEFIEKAIAKLDKILSFKDNSFELQKLKNVYLNSEEVAYQKIKGSKQFADILFIVSLLLLFLASINYVVMSLGLNLSRIKEFKAKRYLGATRLILFYQLLVESLLNIFICFVFTLLTYPLFSDFIKSLLGFTHKFSYANDISILVNYFLFLVFIATLTSSIEFLVLKRNITKFTKGATKKTNTNVPMLIGFQLVLFVSIICVALFVNKQINFIQAKDLGFDNEDIYTINNTMRKDKEIEDFLEKNAKVNEFTRGKRLFYEVPDLKDIKIVNTNTTIKANIKLGYPKYEKTHQLTILQGSVLRKLPGIIDSESIGEVVVNEKFIKQANLKNPIGTIIQNSYFNNHKAEIIGVFKDVHNMPLYNPMEPIVVGTFNIKVNGFILNIDKINIDAFKKEYDIFQKNLLVEFKDISSDVLSVDYAKIYEKETNFKNLLIFFAFIVITISVLGLIATSVYVTQNRTKEIGIRKINGATTLQILKMLNKSFVFWVGIAFVFAVPVSYIIMQKWLQNFAFKTVLSWWVFALSGLIVLVISLLAVSWQTYKAATQNPVKALRDD